MSSIAVLEVGLSTSAICQPKLELDFSIHRCGAENLRFLPPIPRPSPSGRTDFWVQGHYPSERCLFRSGRQGTGTTMSTHRRGEPHDYD